MNIVHKLKKVALRYILFDIFLFTASLYLSLYLRVPHEFIKFSPIINTYLPIFIVLKVITMVSFGAYRVIWRYISTYDAIPIVKAIALSSVFTLAVSFLMPEVGRLPRSVFFIDLIIASSLTLGARLSRRMLFESKNSRSTKNIKDIHAKALIYGAGVRGRALANRIKADTSLGVKLAGFLDDDLDKKNYRIAGYEVLGTGAELEYYIRKLEIDQLIIAFSVDCTEQLSEIFKISRKFNIQPKIVNDNIKDEKKGELHAFRDINLSDLLKRQRRDINVNHLEDLIQGKTVLVTGAGGSIGSELCRQIHSHNPSKLLLLDHSEFNLYQIDGELRKSTASVEHIVPLLIDLKDKTMMNHALKEHMPDIVFHAAAYKHVHLVESNPHSAVLNNIEGTLNLLQISQEINVQNFVQVSTDKAVNPAGIMGATKRVCELLTTAYGIINNKAYCSVRFGNVLGSSGSLIPLLQKQIESGGPVTVTHKDMKRYFMLIPEAVSLILYAGSISRPGDINVLKMGEPVKILDIAKSLITLMGYSTEEIPIIFTELRPGEKMFEELYLSGNEIKTEHPDILTLPDGDVGFNSNAENNEISQVVETIQTIIGLSKKNDNSSLHEIQKLIKSSHLTNLPSKTKSTTNESQKLH